MTRKFGENWLMKCIVVFSFWGASPPQTPIIGSRYRARHSHPNAKTKLRLWSQYICTNARNKQKLLGRHRYYRLLHSSCFWGPVPLGSTPMIGNSRSVWECRTRNDKIYSRLMSIQFCTHYTVHTVVTVVSVNSILVSNFFDSYSIRHFNKADVIRMTVLHITTWDLRRTVT